MGMIDLLDDIDRLGRGLDEVGFDGAERLEGQRDATGERLIETGRENFLCIRTACSRATPVIRFRCLGEPITIIFPPRSAQRFTRVSKY